MLVVRPCLREWLYCLPLEAEWNSVAEKAATYRECSGQGGDVVLHFGDDPIKVLRSKWIFARIDRPCRLLASQTTSQRLNRDRRSRS
jgi:hypothetical protein